MWILSDETPKAWCWTSDFAVTVTVIEKMDSQMFRCRFNHIYDKVLKNSQTYRESVHYRAYRVLACLSFWPDLASWKVKVSFLLKLLLPLLHSVPAFSRTKPTAAYRHPRETNISQGFLREADKCIWPAATDASDTL